jgi:hypothetical protein
MARMVAIIGAVAGWAALVLQLVLTLTAMRAAGIGAPQAVWRYLGYFTILANLFAALMLSGAAMGRLRPRREFMAATAMMLVGIVYALLLRESWNPQGPQKLADIALHDLQPVLVGVFWLLRPHGRLGPRDAAAALVLPLVYCLYALARGAVEGWYPYPFLDVAQIGAGAVARNCAGIGVAFLAMALLLLGLDRLLGRYRQV